MFFGKKKPLKIQRVTANWLRGKLGILGNDPSSYMYERERLEKFKLEWPNGFDITPTNVRRMVKNPGYNLIDDKLWDILSDEAYEQYEIKRAKAEKIRNRLFSKASKKYGRKITPAKRVRNTELEIQLETAHIETMAQIKKDYAIATARIRARCGAVADVQEECWDKIDLDEPNLSRHRLIETKPDRDHWAYNMHADHMEMFNKGAAPAYKVRRGAEYRLDEALQVARDNLRDEAKKEQEVMSAADKKAQQEYKDAVAQAFIEVTKLEG